MTNPETHLAIEAISKEFGSVKALNNIDLEIERGSFVCLLGPSGCGKTTLLRIIAGFEKATSGRMMLDGIDITNTAPHKRGFGMVFQSLALFPHMSVAKNIAYGLKLRKASAKEQRDRVEELLELIELPSIADRPVSALSGGQRQRVAIARALAIQPPLFLLDEPLSALDAKLRDNMQIELRQLQQKFGVTTILVTHDQTEAMMLADSLVVMKDGVIHQVGSPSTVYQKPADLFVADFLGSANLLKGSVNSNGTISVLGVETQKRTTEQAETKLTIAIRAEDLSLRTANNDATAPKGEIKFARDLGPSVEWIVSVGNEQLRVRSSRNNDADLAVGDKVDIHFNSDHISVFPS